MKLTIEKPIYGGDSLGRIEGKAVFVPLALPGETVSIRVIEDKRSFSKAELEEVLTASPNRAVPQCPYFGSCGGCHYQHADYATQLAMKQQILRETLNQMLGRAGVATPEKIAQLAGEPWGYRNRIRLALDPQGKPGYRSRNSHTIIPVAVCPISAPVLIETALHTSSLLAGSPVPITELELFTNHDQSQLLVTLFCESAPSADPAEWLREIHRSLPKVNGLRLQFADGDIEQRILAFSGEASLTYTVAGVDYRVEQGAFFQVNRYLLDDFVSLITRGQAGQVVRAGQEAWDLYAGVGLFSHPLTRSFAKVSAVEAAGASFNALRANLAGTSGTAIGSTTLDFLRRNREQRESRPDLIILDPPRAGLGPEVTQLLNAIHAPQMVYVSCDPTTLARDLRSLTQERFRITSMTQIDMFPQTFHMETAVHLSRS